MLASIPSPGGNSLDIGPLSLNAYGLMIALGVVAAIWLTGRRFEEKGIGTREDATAIGLWAVAAGVIGSRLYHVVTDWDRFEGHYGDVVKIWQGGLGIPGGLLAGIPVGIWVAHRRGLPMGLVANCAAPAIALAQAIGRWGNWFNQELFGGPTTLPWALRVDPAHRPAAYAHVATFHPTFLYESLWNLGLVALLLIIERTVRLRPGRLFVIYVAGYALGRLWVERLRIDHANRIAGLRVNEWVSLIALAFCLVILVRDRYRPRSDAQGAGEHDGSPAAGGHADTPT